VRKEHFGDDLETRVDAVRRFNRFFTRRIGVLREGLLHSPYSLAEARIMFEIAHRELALTASDLSCDLGLDPGYLSRMLARLEQQGLVEKVRSETDARRRLLSLTIEGKEAFSSLDARSREEVAEMLGDLSEGDQLRLLEAMRTIEDVVDEGSARGFKFSEPFFLRQHEPGDMGWVVHRHGVLYAKEYSWDQRFEALVARIVADYAAGHDPAREAAWIAELEGRRVGCVFCVADPSDREAAKLRILLVDQRGRGHGLGGRLVDTCLEFARRAGYARMRLWTNHPLEAARRIYLARGFTLTGEEPHRSFGVDLVGQTYERDLDTAGGPGP